MYSFFAAAPKGFEYALAGELTSLGAVEVRESVAGCYFSASIEQAYQIVMWSRLASRLVLIIYKGPCETAQQLYDAAYCIDWPSHFDYRRTFSIDFHGTGGFINNTQFGALKIKDAVVDRFREDCDRRPDVSRTDADIRLDAHYRNNQITIGLNFSGPAMHQRGYRDRTGEAPLKENLAVHMLHRSGWAHDQQTLMDPFCGSGTVLIEAALMAADVAPAINRTRFGFEHWRAHRPAAWQLVKDEAEQRASAGLTACKIQFTGSDIDGHVVALAKRNAEHAGVSHLIEFNRADALTVMPTAETGYVVTNPPYGERLGNMSGLLQLYYQLGDKFKRDFGGWKVAMLCSDVELVSSMKLKADKQMKMFNGALECVFNLYTLHANSTRREVVSLDGIDISTVALPFANRLKKNIKALEKWAKKEGIDSYRIYDADIPEYNAAIDRYLDYVVVQEYSAPANIPENITKRRMTDMLLALPMASGVNTDKIIIKTRERQKGVSQYQKLNLNKDKLELITTEYGCKFKLNLTDYLDTGLFLDHRLTRRLVGQKAKDRDVLNLFAYTGSASVHAGKGGAKSVTTVDMSNTYLNWAKDNFVLNGLMGRQYNFEQADCLQWVKDCQQSYDLIFIDPPTFSNSKRMEDSWDVQRDHVNVLADLKKLLRPGGEIIFSNNKRKFKLDIETLTKIGLVATNMDEALLPMDYKRNAQIHNVWLITHA
ncbi:bifunctional 23S rRNA (guanine(2069)-N(7))-methyltransferase RlmK/23S rRNA (guanine(2445)-N(2))-methyltransferase RlmL [Shewanella sp. SNU WT4]|uniref:bifunctional 23S rRNA (guanine(2069)-N(7))-methyltransferase RlmK/23S rRNA (guanine(2445)-N(2))-methyltransferase RlmL n=1 Tax=Shewanella sp. SNU WT4 TaxID=2590015 RepID=UPI001127A713|nr:bifunctional 23S rRNA (guanine(2069)-N(7))-methyltransferase RlmK/23S rRNA (guanine(2445)-N(2))-methyltransferase RlmL [Shewanella sp. SNU WT4]QDF67239.1 bifunctional 23S rRNA (guanine(2069)-N(7))-methyltransferase RlmK/23S rRNA (guanine(2445)-N(2))-methyltransferase RlmL [Shewanella sp. SNU WT4]